MGYYKNLQVEQQDSLLDTFLAQEQVSKLIQEAKTWINDYGNSLFPDGSQFAEDIVRRLAEVELDGKN